MFYNTHKLIAKNTANLVNDYTGVKLDEKYLIWGSVKPDFIVPFVSMKHYMEESLDFVVDKIQQVIQVFKSCVNIDIKYLSSEIGIISHFLSDFFCLPHSERWDYFTSGKTIDHIIYEKKLSSISESIPMVDKVNASDLVIMTKEHIKLYILELYHYYKQKQGYLNDYKSAVNISSAISILIVNDIYLKSQKSITVLA